MVVAEANSANFGDKMTDFSAPEQPKWKSLSLTHVEYPEGDLFGKLLACISLAPLVIIVGFCTLVLFRRDLHTISYFVGLLLNELCNFVLKHLIREQRPKVRDVSSSIGFTEYGMPSSHSQFIWFYASYLSLFLIIRVYRNHSCMEDLWKYFLALVTYVGAVAVSYSRVYLGYHTAGQVMYGGITGFILGIIWFHVVHLVFTPYFPQIAARPEMEFLMIRDSTLIPNVLWFEYTSSRCEARSRLRKFVTRKSQ